MKTWNRFLSLAGTAAFLFTLGACGGGGSSTSSPETGSLRLALTDAPACGYDHVYVTIERVRVHQSGSAEANDSGWSDVVLSPPRRVDLLTLTNGVLDELGQTPLPVGRYTQMRLVLAANGNTSPYANAVWPTGAAGEVALTTPSAQQSGLKMNVNIDIAANRMADFVIDFDACKSIVLAGNSGRYLLKPVISVIPRYVSGVLGYVDASVLNATVSLQQAGVVIKSTVPDLTGRFLLQPVAPGTYDLVLTAPGRATAVVTGVPVSADTVLSLNAATAAMAPASSASGVANGAISVTPAGPLDATVRALQTITPTTIEVASTRSDETTGLYTMTLPLAEPVLTAYAVPLPPFTAASGVAGRYTLQANLYGSVKSAGPVSVPASGAATTNFSFP